MLTSIYALILDALDVIQPVLRGAINWTEICHALLLHESGKSKVTMTAKKGYSLKRYSSKKQNTRLASFAGISNIQATVSIIDSPAINVLHHRYYGIRLLRLYCKGTEHYNANHQFLNSELIMTKVTTSIYLATLLFLFFTCSFSASTSLAQQMVFRSSDDGSMAIMAIPGGMLIVEGQEEARVRRSMAPAQSGTEGIDVKEGDLIIFLNGTRITSTNQLNALYEKVEIGTEVKLGIQRGENKMIRAFKKPELQENYSSTDGNGARVMSFSTGGPAKSS